MQTSEQLSRGHSASGPSVRLAHRSETQIDFIVDEFSARKFGRPDRKTG